jgi:nucleoside diphosphate kinase
MFARSLRLAARRTSHRTFAAAASQAAPNGGGGGGGSLLAAVALAGAGYTYYDMNEKNTALQAQVNDLQVQVSGKTNSAFVFIKPHACKGTPGKVEKVVEDKFAASGIRITGKGEMVAETIDKEMYIDTHYGAIASKAVKLKPNELNVPDKGKKDFEKAFGETWDSALAAGKIYNAKDAAAKLGVDSEGLNAKWSKLTKGKDLIKFGGGFYCGKVDGIYVMNGFYMSMRAGTWDDDIIGVLKKSKKELQHERIFNNLFMFMDSISTFILICFLFSDAFKFGHATKTIAYCNPGEKIQWYTVSWPSDSLSWEDFRGKVLGATDPTAAPAGSIRRTILDQYKSLGLKTKPNTGDNGVHASASPFEGLAERMNWLGKSVEEDAFGKALLAKGISKDTIKEWAGDAQVTVNGETKDGKTMSVFDTLEDLDSDTILDKVDKIGK